MRVGLNIATLGIIAGNGVYPLELARAARQAGVSAIAAAAFENETSPELAPLVDRIEWMRVGQLGRLLKFFAGAGVTEAVMAGQISPKNLFELRPDFKALLLIGKLKRRNAETLFRAVADELEMAGVKLLPATVHLEANLAGEGHLAGPRLKKRHGEEIEFGFEIAKEMSRLDIGQTVVVRRGTVLAVEAFEGTNEALRRGGTLGRGEAVAVKVSKPNQDFRFDVPVAGPVTLETAAEAGIRVLAVESGRTLFLEKEKVFDMAAERGITLFGKKMDHG